MALNSSQVRTCWTGNTSKGGSSNLWNKILPISDTFHQRQLTVISDNAEPLVYVFTLETSIPPFFVAINFVILPFLVSSASGEQWWLISFVMMSWPYLSIHLAECDEEAGDLVNSLEERMLSETFREYNWVFWDVLTNNQHPPWH